MRTEYTFIIKHPNGNTDYCTYTKSTIMDKYNSAKAFYESKGCEVKLYKVRYIGNSFHDKEEIETV